MPKGDFNKVARLLLQLSSLITSSALISGTYFIDEKANYNIAFLQFPRRFQSLNVSHYLFIKFTNFYLILSENHW